jgi:hypothetical protein
MRGGWNEILSSPFCRIICMFNCSCLDVCHTHRSFFYGPDDRDSIPGKVREGIFLLTGSGPHAASPFSGGKVAGS